MQLLETGSRPSVGIQSSRTSQSSASFAASGDRQPPAFSELHSIHSYPGTRSSDLSRDRRSFRWAPKQPNFPEFCIIRSFRGDPQPSQLSGGSQSRRPSVGPRSSRTSRSSASFTASGDRQPPAFSELHSIHSYPGTRSSRPFQRPTQLPG